MESLWLFLLYLNQFVTGMALLPSSSKLSFNPMMTLLSQPEYSLSSAPLWSRRSILSVPLGAAIGGSSLILRDPGEAIALAQSDNYDAFASDYDSLDGGPLAAALGLDTLRSQVVGRASGRVLEVGVGTGLNLEYYDPSRVEKLDAIDLSAGMLAQCSQRLQMTDAGSDSVPTSLRDLRGKVKLSVMDASHLNFEDGVFDTVIDTFSLCVFSDPVAALREMRRVCKKGEAPASGAEDSSGQSRGVVGHSSGRVLLLEHSSVSEATGSDRGNVVGGKLLAAYQDATAAPVARLGKGCVWNQRLLPLLQEAGLDVVGRRTALGGLLSVIEAVPSSA